MKNTNRKALVLTLLLLLAPQAEAIDFNRVLNGNYAVTFTRVCAQSAAGFGPQLQPLGQAQQVTSTVEMVQTYNGDGTSSAAGHALNVINNAARQSGHDFTCAGTYQVNNDGSISEDMICSGTVVAGLNTDQTFTQTGVRRAGRIGILAQTLVIGDTGVNVENITFSVSGAFPQICGRSGTAVKIR